MSRPKFRCPTCGHRLSSVEWDEIHTAGRYIKRRRECLACRVRYWTYEIPESLYRSFLEFLKNHPHIE